MFFVFFFFNYLQKKKQKRKKYKLDGCFLSDILYSETLVIC